MGRSAGRAAGRSVGRFVGRTADRYVGWGPVLGPVRGLADHTLSYLDYGKAYGLFVNRITIIIIELRL